MRILSVHNHYGDRAFGGEVNVVEAEQALLQSYGHDVALYTCANSHMTKKVENVVMLFPSPPDEVIYGCWEPHISVRIGKPQEGWFVCAF